MTLHRIAKLRFLMAFPFVLIMAACGAANLTSTPPPTVTPFPTYGYVPPTEAPAIVTMGEATATAGSSQALDTQAIDAGKSRYVALECGSCHGDDAKEGPGDERVGQSPFGLGRLCRLAGQRAQPRGLPLEIVHRGGRGCGWLRHEKAGSVQKPVR